jgi:hypothetical protein
MGTPYDRMVSLGYRAWLRPGDRRSIAETLPARKDHLADGSWPSGGRDGDENEFSHGRKAALAGGGML